MRLRLYDLAAVDAGFGAALPGLAAVQRASLGRGLAFVLLLALACLVVVYGPLAFGIDGPGRPGPAVEPLAVTMPRLPLAAALPGPLPR